MSITALPVKTLVKVLAKLRGGEIGFDPYRDARTSKKENLLAFILAEYSNDAIISAVTSVTGEEATPADAGGVTGAYGIVDHPQAPLCPHWVTYEDMLRKQHCIGFACEADAQAWITRNPVRPTGRFGAPMTPPTPPEAPAILAAPPAIPAATPSAQDPRMAALQALLTPQLDEEKIRAICDARATDYVDNILKSVNLRLGNYDAKIEALTNRKPVVERIVVEQAGKPAVELKEKVNPAFYEVLAMAAHYPNIMLVGPAGCGKTHLARQVATALGKSFSTLSCSAGTPESSFTGRLLPTGDGGKFEYMSSTFLDEYEKDDGAFLIDEYDALDPSCHMVTNGATANGGFTVDMRKAAGLDPYVRRGARSLLIASANTYGNGADAIYTARFQQDASAPDRWYIIPVDYDRELEATLAPDHICDWVWTLREKVASHKLRRVVSTRMLQKASAAHAAKRPMAEIRERMLSGWTREERAKCGV